MKTTKSRKSKQSEAKKKPVSFRKNEDALAVLRDVSNGKEYYLSIIDSFPYKGRNYVVMYNYEPDDGNHADPELVVMRSEFSDIGNQCFYSITNSKELRIAFSHFVERFAKSPSNSRRKA